MGNGRRYFRYGARGVLSTCALLACQLEPVRAHTVSIGYESSGPGDLTFWFGTYHTGVNYTEGSMQLVGTGYSVTAPFTLLTLVKPAGLIDGTTNFYSNGTALVGSFAASAYVGSGPVAGWQGAPFTGLHPGTYTFTYIPIASPTAQWRPIDAIILHSTVDLSGALLGGTQLSPFAGNANQRSVAGAFDAASTAGVSNPGFTALGSMAAANIPNALDQLSGEGAAGGRQAALQSLNPFLTMMVDPFLATRDSAFGPGLGFAPERELSPVAASAYAAVALKADAAPDRTSRWNVWGSAYGGQNKSSGDLGTGSHDTSVRAAGIASGFDYRVAPTTVVGFALAGGNTSWGLSDNLGGGRSDVFQSGVYGSTRVGAAYVSGSLAVAWHSMSTDRSVTISGLDRLTGSFNALNYGGRVESGYRFATPVVGVTPYAALQVQAFQMPSYSETSATGAANFALTYNAQTSTDTRSEIGAWLDKSFAVNRDDTLILRGRVAWAHDWVSGTGINAVFQVFPTTSFTVNGAPTAPDSMLVSTGVELKLSRGITLGVKFDGQFASAMQTYAGTGTVRYSW
jgi:outer membrane autotransporter protein